MKVADHELMTVRVVKADLERVFAAFTDPQILTRWWGPNGFTSTFHEHDARTGGKWRFTFHGPDGREYKNELVYLEVTPPHRIVLNHVTGPVYTATFQFTAVEGGTHLHWYMHFENKRFLDENADFVVKANEENLDRLEAVLR